MFATLPNRTVPLHEEARRAVVNPEPDMPASYRRNAWLILCATRGHTTRQLGLTRAAQSVVQDMEGA